MWWEWILNRDIFNPWFLTSDGPWCYLATLLYFHSPFTLPFTSGSQRADSRPEAATSPGNWLKCKFSGPPKTSRLRNSGWAFTDFLGDSDTFENHCPRWLVYNSSSLSKFPNFLLHPWFSPSWPFCLIQWEKKGHQEKFSASFYHIHSPLCTCAQILYLLSSSFRWTLCAPNQARPSLCTGSHPFSPHQGHCFSYSSLSLSSSSPSLDLSQQHTNI